MKSQNLFFLLFFLILSLPSQGQKTAYTYAQADKKIQQSFRDINQQLQKGQVQEALKALVRLQKREPLFLNPYWTLSDVYRSQGQLNQALQSLEQSFQLAPDVEPRLYLVAGSLCLELQDYNKAQTHLNKLLSYSDLRDETRNLGEKRLAEAKFRPQALANPLPYQPKNLGPKVNSSGREYFPSLTADENWLIFTVQVDTSRRGQEDLYFSRRDEQGIWQERQALPNINTSENEAAQSISANGRFLVFTVCNRPGDMGSCDLYYSELHQGQWSKPRNLGPPINSPAWESQPSLSPNGEELIFTRGGAGGRGSRNLFSSRRQTDGSWSEPQALNINTPYNESGPCLHPDGQTLYFASDGYVGMGDLDLFVSRRQADGLWGPPENLGYPINTAGREEALSVSFDGQTAYIAAQRPEGYGSLDIYSFEMPPAHQPKKLSYVRFKVIHAQTKQSLQAEIKMQIGQEQKRNSTLADGSLLLPLVQGQSYALQIEKTGFVFYSERFEWQENSTKQEPIEVEIPLQPLPEKIKKPEKPKGQAQPIVLKNVFFATGSAALLPSSANELQELQKLLEQRPDLNIELRGHTDNEGEAQANLDLSKRRAEAVKHYLVERGIKAERLSTQGYGQTLPIAPNDSPEGRQKNRRTEFLILEN